MSDNNSWPLRSKYSWEEFSRVAANSNRSINVNSHSSNNSKSSDNVNHVSDVKPTSSKGQVSDTNEYISRLEHSRETRRQVLLALANSDKPFDVNNQLLNNSNNSSDNLNHVTDVKTTSNYDATSHLTTSSFVYNEIDNDFSKQNGKHKLTSLTDNSIEKISVKNLETSNSLKYSSPTKTDDSNRFKSYYSLSYNNPKALEKDEPLSKLICSSNQNNFEEEKNFKQIIPCLKGLTNHGNTCYFNALMQCLAGCDQFAKFFLCNEFIYSYERNLFNSFVNTIRYLWFNNKDVNAYCLTTIRGIGKMNKVFSLGQQHDSYECMIWLLNKLQEDIPIIKNKIVNSGTSTFRYRSNDQSTSFESTRNNDEILDLFRCTLRNEIKCINPNCGYNDIFPEPCLSVSLSVPLLKPRKIIINFISIHPTRKITRFHLNISNNSLTIKNLKDQLMGEIKISSNNIIAFIFMPNGQSYFLWDDLAVEKITFNNIQFNEFTFFEIPAQSIQLYNLKIAVVNFVIGTYPDLKMSGMPFVATLESNNYYCLIEKGTFLLPRPYYEMDLEECTLFKEYNIENVIRIIVQWNLSLKKDFEIYSHKETINDNYNLLNKNNDSKNTPIQLNELINNFVKSESIENWKCQKCGELSGSIQICFDSLPDILIFYLKRFDTSQGFRKKNERDVIIPIEDLNLSSYVYKNKKDNNSLIYNLNGVIFHHGSTISSGHYTASNKNFIDKKWRFFNDSSVSEIYDPLKGSSNLNKSSSSYMLFYKKQQQSSDIPWFPQNVPEHIINNYSEYKDKYIKNYSKDENKSFSRAMQYLIGYF